MKQKLKRFMAGFLAMLTVFTTLFTNGTTAFAASPSANIAFWYASTKASGEVSELKPGYSHGKILYAVIDGNAAYCMNFGLAADGGQLMNSYENSSTSMTAEQEKLLSYCLYYGYGTNSATAPSNDQCDQFIATQAMVWVIVANIYGTSSADSAAQKLCNTAPNPTSSYNYYTSLKNNINASYYVSVPSFAATRTSKAPTYELKWNEANQRFETTLTDSNGVLGNFSISLSGYSVDKSGNSVTISSKEVNTNATTATMDSTIGAVETTTSCVFWLTDKSGYQEFVSERPQADPVHANAPLGYVSSEEIVDYNAAYQGQDVKVVKLESEFVNTPTMVEITKTDITSKAELSGATLIVTDRNGNVIDTWTSVAGEAHVIKRLHVGEVYILREEFAPYGYLQAEEIQFTISDTEDVQYVEMQDEVPTGTIVINKDGEFLTDINLIKGHWYDFVFDYFKKSLAGVTFEVYAAEDIVSPDGLNTVYYAKDTLVAEIVTNDKGIASIEDLPLGKYYLIETKTLEGFVLDSEPIMANLSYVDQDTEVVYAGMEVTNERQKVQVTVIKTDAETKNTLEGAIFGLYAAEDIVNADGKVIVAKDTLVEKAVTGTDGKCVFVSDLPLGQYYVKEMEAPKGYVLNEEIFALDASYQGDDVKVIELEATFANYPTKLEISKTDITGEYELKGATLSIIDKDGNVVETWKSDGETHYIERIPVGEYILREEAAPYGYKIANEVKFTVENTKEIQKVSMKDELVSGKIIIEKTDEVTGKGIAGVEFEIRDKDGNFVEDIKYYVVETKAAEGYILDSTPHEVVLQYDDDAPEIVTYTLNLTNKPTEPKLPQTGDNMNPWLYVGIGAAALLAGIGVCLFKKKEEEEA